MLDKLDPPSIPDGYSLSLAFLCLLDVVRCVQGIIEVAEPVQSENEKPPESEPPDENKGKFHKVYDGLV